MTVCPILAHNVHIGLTKNKLLLILRTSKMHWTDKYPQSVKISSQKHAQSTEKRINNQEFCPFLLIRKYIML